MPTPLTDIKTRDADSTLDWYVEWADWLPSGDSLSGVSMSCTPAPSILSGSPTISGTRTVFWLTGGTPGVLSSILVHVTTAGGRIDERTVQVRTTSR